MIRSMPSRLPAWLANTCRAATASSPSDESASPTVCSTPTVRPMIDTGTHTAEHRPSAPFTARGHGGAGTRRGPRCRGTRASAAARRHALGGRTHLAAGRNPVRRDGEHAREVGLAVVREQQLRRDFGSGGAHRAFDGVERGRLVARHLERTSQAALELASSRLGRHHATWRASRARSPDRDASSPRRTPRRADPRPARRRSRTRTDVTNTGLPTTAAPTAPPTAPVTTKPRAGPT